MTFIGVSCAAIGFGGIAIGLVRVAHAGLREACRRGGWLWCWRRRREIRAEIARLRGLIEPHPRTAQPTFDQRFTAITADLSDVEDLAATFYEEAQ